MIDRLGHIFIFLLLTSLPTMRMILMIAHPIMHKHKNVSKGFFVKVHLRTQFYFIAHVPHTSQAVSTFSFFVPRYIRNLFE